jgi:hypothetical protein
MACRRPQKYVNQKDAKTRTRPCLAWPCLRSAARSCTGREGGLGRLLVDG